MGEHSIVEARDQLSTLIDRALAGEDVVITRDGLAVVTLRAVEPRQPPTPPRMTPAESIAWLRAHRVGQVIPEEDAGTFVSRMRDEEWEK
jgi:antitoxin (DNA-binding transcriptional repressor) of toxin-antitoxin stability system